MTPKNVKPLLSDTKSHSKFQLNMICSFGAILAWKSADDAANAADNYDDDRKSDPYMSPSYAGDTIKLLHNRCIYSQMKKYSPRLIFFLFSHHFENAVHLL